MEGEVSLVQLALEIEPTLPGQSHIEHQAGGSIRSLREQELLCRFKHNDPHPDRLEEIAQRAADGGIVVDYKYHRSQVTHRRRRMSGNGKDPAPFSTPGAIHRGVGHASMAEESPFSCSMEHEGIVDKLHNRQIRCVHHELERFNPRTYRRGNTRFGSRRCPSSDAGHCQCGSNSKQTDLAHLRPPIQSQATRWGTICRTMSSAYVSYFTLRPSPLVAWRRNATSRRPDG